MDLTFDLEQIKSIGHVADNHYRSFMCWTFLCSLPLHLCLSAYFISVLIFLFKNKKYGIEVIVLILFKVDIEMKFSKFIMKFGIS
jgi:hypothetical protein